MANTFKLKTDTAVGTTLTTVYTVPSSPATTTIVIGCTLANIHASANLNADVQIVTAASSGENGDDVYVIKGVPVPNSSSLEIIEGKIVLETGDAIKVRSDTASSIDVALSVLEQT
tara:strand:- start:57 stop:404 length:348 start_codon:yes stop_codon:yes gene_type:complete